MMTAIALLPIIIFFWYVRRRYVIVTVRGHSMMPTFRDGQRVLVRRRTSRRALRVGDVAVFPTPASAAGPDTPAWLVKRVTAVAGDKVPPELPTHSTATPTFASTATSPDISTTTSPDISPDISTATSPATELIPPGQCVVRGDNPRSLDSRHFGYLAERSVLGVVCAPRR